MAENTENDNQLELSMRKLKMHLMNDELKEAFDLTSEFSFPDNELKIVCNEVIDIHSSMGEYALAAKVADIGQINDIRIKEVYHQEYKKLMKSKKHAEAAAWGKEYGLSELEINRAANFAYVGLLKKNEFEEAIDVFEEFDLKKDEMLSVTIEEFNRAFAINNYRGAAALGDKFNFSRSRTLGAAYKAYSNAINASEFTEAINLAQKFRLFKEDSIEALVEFDIKSLLNQTIEKYIEPLIKSNNIDGLFEFYDRTEMKDIGIESVNLKEFQVAFFVRVIEKHNKILLSGKLVEAAEIKNRMNLLTTSIPKEYIISMLEVAEQYHNKVLEKGEVKQAVDVKVGYDLFSKNTSVVSFHNLHRSLSVLLLKVLQNNNKELAKLILSEYELPKEYAKKSLLLGVMHLLDKGKLKEALEVQSEFNVKIFDEESKHRVHAKFRELIQKKEFKTAIIVGEKFEIGNNILTEGAYRFWEHKMNEKKYDDAYLVFDEYNIPRKKTKELATAHYNLLKKNGKPDVASNIRKTYRLPVGLFEFFMEFVSVVFGTRKE